MTSRTLSLAQPFGFTSLLTVTTEPVCSKDPAESKPSGCDNNLYHTQLHIKAVILTDLTTANFLSSPFPQQLSLSEASLRWLLFSAEKLQSSKSIWLVRRGQTPDR